MTFLFLLAFVECKAFHYFVLYFKIGTNFISFVFRLDRYILLMFSHFASIVISVDE